MPGPLTGIPHTLIGDVAVDARDLATNIAAGAVGTVPLVFRFAFADGATNSQNKVMVNKVRVLACEVLKTSGAGAAGNTVQVLQGGTAITNAMDTNVADEVIVRPATITDAQFDVTVGAQLRVTNTKAGGNSACIVTVWAMRID